jgi:serine/threonine-protein kinase
MAVVWRAATLGAEGFARPVAVKRVLSGLGADPHFIAMFVEEARVSATLDHPNIVHIHDFGVDEAGGHYLVMEWVEGLDLRRFVLSHAAEGEVVPWPLAVHIIAEVLAGLHAAHTRETDEGDRAPIFHRDVTPQNVLLSVRGAVKLSDFGLARAMDRARTTTPGIVKGKLSYLAPETLQDAHPSAQSDIYGVGIVLWEVLAGTKLFDADTDMGVIEKVARGVVPSLAAIRPDLPSGVVEAVHAALERDPAKRPRDARAMGNLLSRELRKLDDPPDAHALAEAVREARERLGMSSGRKSLDAAEAIPLVPLETAPNPDPTDPEIDVRARVRDALFSKPPEPSTAAPLPLSRKKKPDE